MTPRPIGWLIKHLYARQPRADRKM